MASKKKRGPGRPKGSKNKKRKPGRPKGSKNKKRSTALKRIHLKGCTITVKAHK